MPRSTLPHRRSSSVPLHDGSQPRRRKGAAKGHANKAISAQPDDWDTDDTSDDATEELATVEGTELRKGAPAKSATSTPRKYKDITRAVGNEHADDDSDNETKKQGPVKGTKTAKKPKSVAGTNTSTTRGFFGTITQFFKALVRLLDFSLACVIVSFFAISYYLFLAYVLLLAMIADLPVVRGLGSLLVRSWRACIKPFIATAALLGVTYTVLFALDHSPEALSATVCTIPIVGRHLMVCQPVPSVPPLSPLPSLPPVPPPAPPGSDMLSKIAAPQEGLAYIMGLLGNDPNTLWQQLLNLGFAVENLKLYVEVSPKLSRKNDIANSLRAVMDTSEKTTRELAHLTAQVRGTIGTVQAFNKYTIRRLDELAKDATHRQRSWAGFAASDPAPAEVKKLLQSTASYLAQRVESMLSDAEARSSELDHIQELLGDIKKLAAAEIGDPPVRDTFQALWSVVGPLNEKPQNKLTKLPPLYDVALSAMRGITTALHNMDAGLKEFETELSKPRSILEEHSFEEIAATIRGCVEKLKASRQKVEE